MYYIGLMSGTSTDAIDAAIVDIKDDDLELVSYRQFPLARPVQEAIRKINSSSSIEEIAGLDVLVGQLFGNAVLTLLDENKIAMEQVRAIGSHGQTVMHLPEAIPPRTLQIGDPNVISWLTGITTVADFRRADMAAGGQAAPLAPAFHAWKFRNVRVDRVVLNIGGIANITILPARADAQVRGFDAGPGNTLMDAWAQQCLNSDFDEQGQWAASGKPSNDLLKLMLDDPYFSAMPPKSTGKDDFNLTWLAAMVEKTGETYRERDVQASLLELTATGITDAITTYSPETGEVLVCGGGIHNPVLMERLQSSLSGMVVKSTGEYGVDPDAVEAVTFAWLAKQRLENIPANLPSVTGAEKPVVLGGIYG